MTNARFKATTGLRPSASSFVLAAVAVVAAPLASQAPTTQELLNRIEAQDQRISELSQSLARTEEQHASSTNLQTPDKQGLPLTASFKKGFRIYSTNPNMPFELKVNGRMQFRATEFDADKNAPVVNPADGSDVNSDENYFEIERARIELSGTFFDKNTHFYINLDADTDDNHSVIFHDFWVNYDFAENHSIYAGKAFTGGSREWLNGSTGTHLIDRSVASTFFRPDRTVGIWAIGRLPGDIQYRMLVGNGLKTTDLSSSQVDQNYVYAGSFWKDFGSAYGKGFADLEFHEEASVRIGTSLTYTEQEEGQGGAESEAKFVMVGRGMSLTDMGADKYDFYLAAADASIKYRGFSANSELYYRWIDDVQTTAGPAARTSYYDWGGYCDLGYLIGGHLEPVVRVSTVQGIAMNGGSGRSWEYAAGLNCYVDGTHKNKLSIDITKQNGSPVANSSPGFRLYDDGLMFRLQWQIAF